MAEARASSAGGVTVWGSVVVLFTQGIGPAPMRKKLAPASKAEGSQNVSTNRRGAGRAGSRPVAVTGAHGGVRAERAAGKGKAGGAPVQPTSAPASAGPAAKATVRASSIRAFAVASAVPGTSAGTSEGAATP